MTIKRKLLLSNILMIAIPIAAYAVLAISISLAIVILYKTNILSPISPVLMAAIKDYAIHIIIIWSFFLLGLVFIIFITARVLTGMMFKTIAKPLDVLSSAAQEIQDNNLEYRINYDDVDEFKNVCDAFNKMAEQLYRMTTERDHAEENRKTLIAGISHDLRTPLTAIKIHVEGLEIGVAADTEKKAKYLSVIKTKADSMEQIINRLFLFSKLDIGNFPMNIQTVDINKTLSKIINDLYEEYEKKSLHIFYQEMINTVFVQLDVILLENVIVNIFENSVQYKNKEQGELRIQVKQVNDTAEISLSDNGPGIAVEQLDKLFNVFYRSDQARNSKGSGLGLAISAKIIQRMNGTIHAERAENRGLTLIIRLPIVSKQNPLQEQNNG